MAKIRPDDKRKIIQFLALIGLSVFTAAIIALFFITYYGPSGRYTIDKTLLSPNLLHGLNYNDSNQKTGHFDRFIFDKIVFSYQSINDRLWHQSVISETRYADFYRLVKDEVSINQPGAEVVSAFMREPIFTLKLIVKTESPASWQASEKTFQEVQFIKDYFRVDLHEQTVGVDWVYFYHPGIGLKAQQLFFN
ncbi:MAG: hypothetical protein ACSNEK_01655 [Parachlamydiaceae bacterium]